MCRRVLVGIRGFYVWNRCSKESFLGIVMLFIDFLLRLVFLLFYGEIKRRNRDFCLYMVGFSYRFLC